ncbi:MAG: phosphoribosylglycinamide formyltransferase [Acidobacteriia bacterium]|nr:phosphoribosylglycinamide formyltransferase [Terriglobia bacterium]
MPKKKLGILLSGRGSNFEAIADNVEKGVLEAEIAIVISNVADARGLEVARRRNLNACFVDPRGKSREEYDREVVALLLKHKVDLICLAGYMRILSTYFIQQFPYRILNIHPALLPAFKGLDAQKQALEYGVKITGCTVHFVDEGVDSGPIVLQSTVPVREDDTEDLLAGRILREEHLLYSKAIALVLQGRCRVEGRCVRVQSPSVNAR